MGALRRDAVLAGLLVVQSGLAIWGISISSPVVSTLVVHVCGVVGIRVVRVAAVRVVVRLLLAVRLGLGAWTGLGLGGGLTRSRGPGDLRIGTRGAAETRLTVLGTALRVLAKVVGLGSIIPAERTLGLRGQALLLTLRALLLREVLVVVVVVAVLLIRRVV